MPTPDTAEHVAEVATLLARHSNRPRFALITYLALLEVSDGRHTFDCWRDDIAEVVLTMLPKDRFQARATARAKRVAIVKEEVKIWEQAGAPLLAALTAEAIGKPTAQAVSHALRALKDLGLIEVGYRDARDHWHAKPARGRRMEITLHRKGNSASNVTEKQERSLSVAP